MLVRQISLRDHRNPPNSFIPILFQTLSPKHPGWGHPFWSAAVWPPLSQLPPHHPTQSGARTPHPPLSTLFFNNLQTPPPTPSISFPCVFIVLQNPFPANPFLSHRYKTPGCHPSAGKTHQTFFRQTGVSLLSNGDPHSPSGIGR